MPIAVVEATDAQSLEFAIIENVQRADLNPIEEAAGYVALMEQLHHTQDEVAKIVGKSRPYVANMVRLLKLPEPVKTLVRQGKLSAGHARLLVGQPTRWRSPRGIGEGCSVRQLEEWRARGRRASPATRPATRSRKKIHAAPAKDADTRALERRLSDALGLEVTIDHKPPRAARCISSTRDLDQLDGVLRKLGG